MTLYIPFNNPCKNLFFFILHPLSFILFSLSFILSSMVDCYIGMGGNLTNTLFVMKRIIVLLKNEVEIKQFKLSRLYQTSPISDIPQPSYLNAVCRFQTTLSLNNLWQLLQNLEKTMGKKPKPKNSPRLIDLDLLFYGPLVTMTEELILPHPRWHERLFVLAPLADVTERVPLKSGSRVREIMERFSNPHQEKVYVLNERLEDA